MNVKSLLSATVAGVQTAVDRFEENVELGFSTTSSNFKANLEDRGINIEEEIGNHPEISSVDEVAAVQEVQGDIELYKKDELELSDQKQ